MIRLFSIDPARAAREAYARVAATAELTYAALGLTPVRAAAAARTPVYRRVRALAAYAVSGGAMPTPPPSDTVPWLMPLMQLGELPREPTAELEFALLAALARETLDRGDPLSAVDLALLCGYDRDHVLALAAGIPGAYRSDDSRHRPWRFRATPELLEWIQVRSRAAA